MQKSSTVYRDSPRSCLGCGALSGGDALDVAAPASPDYRCPTCSLGEQFSSQKGRDALRRAGPIERAFERLIDGLVNAYADRSRGD
ncbi:MAG: hypothetical protein JWN44_3594 [Myxococcales bacterium]|nr:hypothetical protein [Myxococcales bacterium]